MWTGDHDKGKQALYAQGTNIRDIFCSGNIFVTFCPVLGMEKWLDCSDSPTPSTHMNARS